jgi:hypothetical protein
LIAMSQAARSRFVPLLLAFGVAVVLLAAAIVLFFRPRPVKSVATSALPPDAAAKVVYDPTKLLEAGVPPGEVFAKEPRDEVWAQAVETVIGGAMKADVERLSPGADVQLVCKTLSCIIGVDVPEDKRPAAMAMVKVLMLGPWEVDLEPEEDGTRRVLFFTEPRFSDPAVFTDWYKKSRKRTFAAIKSGERPNPVPIEAAQLPDE